MDFSWGAFVAAAAVFVAAYCLARLVRREKWGDTPTFLTLLLTPLIIYGIASKSISELSGPVGTVKFQQAAQATVAQLSTNVLDADAAFVGEKSVDLRDRLKSHPPGQPMILTLKLGVGNYMSAVILDNIKALTEDDRDSTVVILDHYGRFFASSDAQSFQAVLNRSPEPVVQAINKDEMDYVANLPSLIKDSIKPNDTNADALQKLVSHKARIMTVVDENDRPKAIVKREVIVAHLVEQLTATDKGLGK